MTNFQKLFSVLLLFPWLASCSLLNHDSKQNDPGKEQISLFMVTLREAYNENFSAESLKILAHSYEHDLMRNFALIEHRDVIDTIKIHEDLKLVYNSFSQEIKDDFDNLQNMFKDEIILLLKKDCLCSDIETLDTLLQLKYTKFLRRFLINNASAIKRLLLEQLYSQHPLSPFYRACFYAFYKKEYIINNQPLSSFALPYIKVIKLKNSNDLLILAASNLGSDAGGHFFHVAHRNVSLIKEISINGDKSIFVSIVSMTRDVPTWIWDDKKEEGLIFYQDRLSHKFKYDRTKDVIAVKSIPF